MTDEEFIAEVAVTLKGLSVQAQVTNSPDTLYLGSYSYMRRFQLVALAKAILELEGYQIVNKTIEQ